MDERRKGGREGGRDRTSGIGSEGGRERGREDGRQGGIFIRAPSYQNVHYFSISFDNYLTTLCCLPLLFIIHRPSLSLIVHV